MLLLKANPVRPETIGNLPVSVKFIILRLAVVAVFYEKK